MSEPRFTMSKYPVQLELFQKKSDERLNKSQEVYDWFCGYCGDVIPDKDYQRLRGQLLDILEEVEEHD